MALCEDSNSVDDLVASRRSYGDLVEQLHAHGRVLFPHDLQLVRVDLQLYVLQLELTLQLEHLLASVLVLLFLFLNSQNRVSLHSHQLYLPRQISVLLPQFLQLTLVLLRL